MSGICTPGRPSRGSRKHIGRFRKCRRQGFRYLETDVHLTSDGILLAFHDDKLDRVTDGSGPIAQLSYDSIRSVRVAGREPIPRLDELLTNFPDTRFNIDPKSDASVDPLIRLIRNLGVQHRVCVGSFSDRRIRRVREAIPSLCTSTGPIETFRLDSPVSVYQPEASMVWQLKCRSDGTASGSSINALSTPCTDADGKFTSGRSIHASK
ncbi:MAG: hypothetical protein CM1200mP9_06320 [Gammaproteobacteria bacterium]|nr:MAG: hypothetical protein CM1200mP9_06320 [Gammaproteobacteria bacterium]